MSNAEVREFEGFDVSNDFVLTLNAKKGKVKVNLQECMAVRLAKSTDDKLLQWYDSTGKDGNDVCKELDISYNHIENCRSHALWVSARESFVDLNSLEDSQAELLKGKKPVSSGNGNGESKVKFTATNAKSLGNAIFDAMPKDLQVAFSNYDANHTDFSVDGAKLVSHPFVYGDTVIAYTHKVKYDAKTTCNARIVDGAISGAISGAFNAVNQYNAEQNAIKRELEKQEREERKAMAMEKAEKVAIAFGLTKPSDDASDADKAEYEGKLNLLLDLVD